MNMQVKNNSRIAGNWVEDGSMFICSHITAHVQEKMSSSRQQELMTSHITLIYYGVFLWEGVPTHL